MDTQNAPPNVDPKEIHQFASIALDWWNPNGSMKPLHLLNPLRLAYIQQHTVVDSHQSILDVGCGGGILSESLAQQGAQVVGIDLCPEVLVCAKQHAASQQLTIDYQATSTTEMASQYPQRFDSVVCMELLEHVPYPAQIVHECAQLTKPGGKVFFSTINRTARAFLGAIVGAEYILGWLPKGTHHYSQFIRPAELSTWARKAQLRLGNIQGIGYQPLAGKFYCTQNISINYMAYYIKD